MIFLGRFILYRKTLDWESAKKLSLKKHCYGEGWVSPISKIQTIGCKFLWMLLGKKFSINFSIVPQFGRKTLTLSVKKFCVPWVENFYEFRWALWEQLSWNQLCSFSWNLWKNVPRFEQSCFARLAVLHFTCLTEHFHQPTDFLENKQLMQP